MSSYVIEEERPPRPAALGLYQGGAADPTRVELQRRLPDKITIFRGPLERIYGHDPDLLAEEIRRVVLHEVAHHFGISDARLIEIDRY